MTDVPRYQWVCVVLNPCWIVVDFAFLFSLFIYFPFLRFFGKLNSSTIVFLVFAGGVGVGRDKQRLVPRANDIQWSVLQRGSWLASCFRGQ